MLSLLCSLLIFTLNCLSNIHASTEPTQTNAFVYKIVTKRRIKQFLNAKNGVRLNSKIMALDDLGFQLHFYPNGRFEHQRNQFVAYLCINDLSEKTKISSVFVDWTLVISETNFSYIVKDRHHSDNQKCRGFTKYNNSEIIKPLKQRFQNPKSPLKKISFGLTISIKKRFRAQAIINQQIPLQINKQNRFVWSIGMNELLLSQHQQTYVSHLFNDLFFLSLTPNGYQEGNTNSFDMFLHLVYLPKEISKLRMKCIYQIPELKINHSLDAQWTNVDKGWGWPARHYPIDMLKLYAANSDKLTLVSECETMAIFDAKGNPMQLKKDWKYFNVSAKSSNAQMNPKTFVSKFAENGKSDYCLETGNMSTQFHFANINRILIDMSQDMGIVRQQLFVTIGIFTVNFGVTMFMFSVFVSLFCCGCF